MPIRPLLLKGHERPLTCVKFNRDSDLLFTCAKDYKPNVWYTDNGERLGTYNGHEGAVYDCDMNFHSTKLLTGSADRTVRLWEIETGKELFRWKFEAAIRSVGFAEGDSMMLAVQDNTFGQHPTIFLYDLAENIDEQQVEAAKELKIHYDTDTKSKPKFNKALWGPLNQTVVSCGDDGYLRVWDVETGVEKARVAAHKKAINCIQFSKDRSMIITASADQTAQVYDYRELRLLRTFTSDRPLNSAAISPIANHVIIGGGQEAMNVTTTAAKAGHFEVDFYNMVYSEYLGSVKGHFGPINTLAFSGNGKLFASGSEDGYVRLHHFDKDYLKNKE